MSRCFMMKMVNQDQYLLKILMVENVAVGTHIPHGADKVPAGKEFLNLLLIDFIKVALILIIY